MSGMILDLHKSSDKSVYTDDLILAQIFHTMLKRGNIAPRFNIDQMYSSASAVGEAFLGRNGVYFYADSDNDLVVSSSNTRNTTIHLIDLLKKPVMLDLLDKYIKDANFTYFSNNMEVKAKELLQESRNASNTGTTTNNTTEGKNIMANIKTTAVTVANQAKEAGEQAVKVEAGRAILMQARPQAIKMMPKAAQVYIGIHGKKAEPFVDVIIAAGVSALTTQFIPDNEKARLLSEATMLAAMQNGVELFDLPKLVDNMLTKLPPEAKALLEDQG
jgi:hypothetical protein